MMQAEGSYIPNPDHYIQQALEYDIWLVANELRDGRSIAGLPNFMRLW